MHWLTSQTRVLLAGELCKLRLISCKSRKLDASYRERGQQTVVSKPQKNPARNRSGGTDKRSEELICLAEEHGGHRAQG